MMGGDVTVTSEPGRGSVFTVRVPVGGIASSQVVIATCEQVGRQTGIGKPARGVPPSPSCPALQPYNHLTISRLLTCERQVSVWGAEW